MPQNNSFNTPLDGLAYNMTMDRWDSVRVYLCTYSTTDFENIMSECPQGSPNPSNRKHQGFPKSKPKSRSQLYFMTMYYLFITS